MDKPTDDYEVGYGKPPKRTQFQKGRSGNPNGRRKESKYIGTIFNRLAAEKLLVNTPTGSKRMTKIEVGIMQLLNSAAKGDPRAIREVLSLQKLYGDSLPALPPRIVQVRFVKPTERSVPPPVPAVPEPEVDDPDDGEWVDRP